MRWWLGLTVVVAACSPGPARVFDVEPLADEVRRCPALPEVLSLGQVPVGGLASHVLTGVGGSATVAGSPDFSVQPTPDGLRLDVRPTAPGPRTAEVTVTSERCDPATIRVEAEGMAPCLVVTPALRFAAVERTCGSTTAPVQVENRCDAPVSLQGFDVEDAADGPDAWCAGGAPCREFGVVSGPSLVPAQSTVVLTARFSPANVGEVTGLLRVVAQERDGRVGYPVALSGTGLARPTITDVFEGMPRPRADLLVILDTSPSMAARRDNVAANLHNFARYLQATEVDAQVSLAAADRSAAGTLVGQLSSRAPDFVADFDRLVQAVPPVTEDTSCMEQALALLERAPPLRRPETPAVVVCITDGADDAPGPWHGLVGRFTSRIAPPTVSVVAPFIQVPGCTTELDDGRLAAWAELREELCTPDWGKSLENIGRVSFGYASTFPLSRPALRIVRVEVGGTELPERDERGARFWSWHTASNAVVFEILFAPDPGQQARVTYEPTCP